MTIGGSAILVEIPVRGVGYACIECVFGPSSKHLDAASLVVSVGLWLHRFFSSHSDPACSLYARPPQLANSLNQ